MQRNLKFSNVLNPITMYIKVLKGESRLTGINRIVGMSIFKIMGETLCKGSNDFCQGDYVAKWILKLLPNPISNNFCC